MISLFRRAIHFLQGAYVTEDSVCVRQESGWVRIPRSEIFAVKFRSVSHVIVRLRHGERVVLDLFKHTRLSNSAWDRVHRALIEGLGKIRPETYERPRSAEQER